MQFLGRFLGGYKRSANLKTLWQRVPRLRSQFLHSICIGYRGLGGDTTTGMGYGGDSRTVLPDHYADTMLLAQAKKRAEILEEQTRPAREVVGERVGAGMSVVGRVVSKVAQQPAVQAVGRATMSAATAVIEAQDRLDKKSQEWETRMLESAAAKKVRAAMGEDPRGKGPVQGIAIDHETNAISIYQETAWERRVRKLKESAFLGPIMGGTESMMDAASEVSNRLGDRVFGETEMSLCMAEIKKDDPSFNTRIFLTKLEKVECVYTCLYVLT